MNTENNQTNPEYLHRNITAEFSLLLFERGSSDVTLKCKLGVENGDSIEQAIVEVLQRGGSALIANCRNLILPPDPLPGDQPMIQLSLEYFHYLESPDESISFSCSQIAVIEKGEINRAIAEVSNQAKALFARKLPALLNA